MDFVANENYVFPIRMKNFVILSHSIGVLRRLSDRLMQKADLRVISSINGTNESALLRSSLPQTMAGLCIVPACAGPEKLEAVLRGSLTFHNAFSFLYSIYRVLCVRVTIKP